MKGERRVKKKERKEDKEKGINKKKEGKRDEERKDEQSDPTVSWPRCGAETCSRCGYRPVPLQESRHHL